MCDVLSPYLSFDAIRSSSLPVSLPCPNPGPPLCFNNNPRVSLTSCSMGSSPAGVVLSVFEGVAKAGALMRIMRSIASASLTLLFCTSATASMGGLLSSSVCTKWRH